MFPPPSPHVPVYSCLLHICSFIYHLHVSCLSVILTGTVSSSLSISAPLPHTHTQLSATITQEDLWKLWVLERNACISVCIAPCGPKRWRIHADCIFWINAKDKTRQPAEPSHYTHSHTHTQKINTQKKKKSSSLNLNWTCARGVRVTVTDALKRC